MHLYSGLVAVMTVSGEWLAKPVYIKFTETSKLPIMQTVFTCLHSESCEGQAKSGMSSAFLPALLSLSVHLCLLPYLLFVLLRLYFIVPFFLATEFITSVAYLTGSGLKEAPWSKSESELYRPSDCRLSAK
jgi:hypothetical protein